MDLTPLQVYAAIPERAGIIMPYAIAQGIGQGAFTALIRPLLALFHGHIELIGKKTGR